MPGEASRKKRLLEVLGMQVSPDDEEDDEEDEEDDVELVVVQAGGRWTSLRLIM